ncbi:hypothetical protein ACLOJK_014936, partial [Asimina triloba]
EDSWGVPDWWEEILPKLISASVVRLEALQQLALMYLRGTASAYLITAALVPSLSEAERNQKRKKRLQKRRCLSIEEESVREEGNNLQAAITLEMASVAVSEALVEPDYARMMGHASVSPLEGIFVVVEGSSLAGLVSTEPNPCFEGPTGPLLLERGSQVIDLEEEGDASLLCEYVALLKSREATLLFECEKQCGFEGN